MTGDYTFAKSKPKTLRPGVKGQGSEAGERKRILLIGNQVINLEIQKLLKNIHQEEGTNHYNKAILKFLGYGCWDNYWELL